MSSGEREVMLAARAAEHGHADFFRDLVAHLCEARTRDEEGDAHLGALDDHLGSKAAGRIEHLVGAGYMWLGAIHRSHKVFYTTRPLTCQIVIKCAHIPLPFLVSRPGPTQDAPQIPTTIG